MSLDGDGYTRSIPACAGEPVIATMLSDQSEVYPRVCGGTRPVSICTAAGQGLSPRVRGNHAPPLPPAARSRSIPACAGEPRRIIIGYPTDRVNQRVCEGTPFH